jgi:hypothetical protein
MSQSLLSPSYSDHRGFYNIRDEDAVHGASDATPSKVFRSTPDVPPLTWAEFRSVAEATCQQIVTRARLLSPPLPDGAMRYCVGDELGDRTVEVELPAYSMLTPEFIAALQQEVLAQHPLWRIMLHGRDDLTKVIVYPTAVRVGDFPADAPLAETLETTIARLLQLHESRDGAHDRQQAYVQALLRRDLPTLGRNDYRLVAVFDNYKGNTGELSIWLLCREDLRQRAVIEAPGEPDLVAHGNENKVRADGAVLELGTLDKNAPYRIIQWVVPRSKKNAKWNVMSGCGSLIDTIRIRPEDVLSDDDVKAFLQRCEPHSSAGAKK